MKGAAPSDEPLDVVATEVAEAAGAVVSAWQHASRNVFPRLSSLQLDALLIVRRCPGINLTRLAEEAGTRSPAVSRLCDRLEAAGLLRRERPATNRREIELVLTVQGQELVEALSAGRRKLFREALSRMTPAERTALVTGLHAFSTASDDRSG
ncbi:hypothetical protein GCM10009730_64450 [Streptomyces albidochromogenes]|uniref:MarR family winged helix-turn-helix transcriptional regulator n=1 Tax=Streptomyces albidochromogenes TaxID=329524 RepID=UPI00110FCBBA|nr:MarR family transcriptional regulator [Streptomyces albidochromogenes]